MILKTIWPPSANDIDGEIDSKPKPIDDGVMSERENIKQLII